MRSPRRQRLLASSIVAVWLVGAGLPLVTAAHVDLVDVACGQTGWRGSAGAAALTQLSTLDGDGHCGVCHLQRALSHAVVSTPLAFLDAVRSGALAAALAAAPSSASTHLFGSRAPPPSV